jgi:hypothetical protein
MPNVLAKVSEVASPPPVVPEGPTGAQTRVTIDPQRLLRIAAVAREVMAEARRVTPEPGMVNHLHRMHERICGELQASLPPQLYEELSALTPEITEESLQELLLAHAEIIGWLEGLFQAVQLALAQPRIQESVPEVPEASAGPDRPDPRYL